MNLMIRAATNPWLAWGLFIVQIIIVVALSSAVMRMNAGFAFLLFILYAALRGVTLSTLFSVPALAARVAALRERVIAVPRNTGGIRFAVQRED